MNRFSLTLLAGAAVLSMATAASAADLLVQQQPSLGGYVDMGGGGSWDGAYVGGFVGYGWGTVLDDNGDIPLGLDDDQLGLSGWLIGATLGANFTVAEGFVVGAVGDIAWSNISGYDSDTDLGYDVNWMGSLRGRAGFDAGAFMPYLTGGLAFAGATADIGPDSSTQMHFGWTAGAGVEVAATENLSVDLLYRYSDYGSATYDLSIPTDLSLTTHTVSAGLNFKF
ncbi:MAG: autotransporter outer rane beta-barrel protein [Devosia sp.]|uniref:outer membrane protein n=1 Tax=Devosia sp. TaxID=1871048 RepID=UPI002618636A|nr:outer membrane protein [Devosia sp.]MDB5539589.1 autotransporter outer rane beta-barrel protein [Devosia sp.]